MADLRHYLWIYPAASTTPVQLTDVIRVDCVLAEMQVGAIEVTLPMQYDDALFAIDSRIALYRRPISVLGSSRLFGNTIFLLRRRRKVATTNEDGSITWNLVITGVHPNHLLGRRLVAYNEGTAESTKSGTADDVMKAIVRENFTAATDATRNWDSSIFTVEADTGAWTAGAVQTECSYKNVLSVLQDLSAQASNNFYALYAGFEVATLTENGALVFRAYVDQRGVDRSSASGQPLILSMQTGNLLGAEQDEDWTSTPSVVYAGGAGVNTERVVQSETDSARLAASPFGRYELFANQSQTESNTTLTGVARHRLYQLRPRQIITGQVQDTQNIAFGFHYDWGDRVVGEFTIPYAFGTAHGWSAVQVNCRVDPVRLTIDRVVDPETGAVDYAEALDIRLRSDDL